jgi:predicted Zn-dependent peptidase
MGYLLGAMTQEKLDNQRGVVQNEKRQGDNRPGGLVEYEVLGNLFPGGHPYHHSTIGSMADLDAASLATVKEWFIDKYGPNNAVLVLAGDVTATEARPLVEKYFGAIKQGPVNVPAAADVPTLAAPKLIVMKDRVAATEIQRYWAVPGLQSNQLAALDVGASILGGLASSRLDRILVREEKLAVSVDAGLQAFQRIGQFEVDATVKARRRSRGSPKKARRDHRGFHRQRPDRGRGSPCRHPRSRRPDTRPRTSRRVRRQGRCTR